MTHSLRAKLGIFLERKKNVDRKSVREFSFWLGETGSSRQPSCSARYALYISIVPRVRKILTVHSGCSPTKFVVYKKVVAHTSKV